jgi:hypothetical protein
MKKNTLKLKLNRETLHALGQPQLEAVAGGGTKTEFGTSCGGSCHTCNSNNTCGTIYC